MAIIQPSTGVAIAVIPVLAALLLYRFDTYDPVPYPDHELTRLSGPDLVAPKRNDRLLHGSEKIGEGKLVGPEEIAYHPQTGVIYTGSADGWIARVTLNDSAADSVVENWVNTSGRPLGIAHGLHGEVIVADAYKGLLNISKDGVIELLSDEADGVKFKLTNAVDIAPDGTIYFTDASYKRGVDAAVSVIDILEPYGRFLSYHPSTKQTRVLVKDLYFANGVAVSADHTFVIFCETAMLRCKKYYIQGPGAGSVGMFVENLPGVPDNIRYDGQGLYWIALGTETSYTKYLVRYPWIRKVVAVVEKYIMRLNMYKDGGAIAVDLDGKPTAHYYDPSISFASSCDKIGKHLYLGSLYNSYITRLDLTRYPAIPQP